MSQAEELLNGLAEEEVVAEAANVDTEPHIVIGTDKFITVPPELRRIAVQHEHNVKTVTFDCPRYWDGRDLMNMVICINYKTPNNIFAPKEAENVIVDPSDDTMIHFDWTITKNVTQANGTLSFLVCGVKTDDAGMEEQHWNSELNREMTISEGMECSESILEAYPDVITDILTRLRRLEASEVVAAQPQMIVTLDLENGVADRSSIEIIEHLNSGGIAVLRIPNSDTTWGEVPLLWVVDNVVTFAEEAVYTDRVSGTRYNINSDKTCTVEEIVMTGGTSGATEEQAAQIQANADAIAEIQNAVVSGTLAIESQKYTITLTMEDGTTETHILETDENNYPVKLTVNGAEIPWTVTGVS